MGSSSTSSNKMPSKILAPRESNCVSDSMNQRKVNEKGKGRTRELWNEWKDNSTQFYCIFTMKSSEMNKIVMWDLLE